MATAKYTHTVKDFTEYTQKTSISMSFYATTNITINSITLHNVYSTYSVTENGNTEIKEITLQCNYGDTKQTVDKNGTNCTFEVNQDVAANKTTTVKVSINGAGTFKLSSGVDSTTTRYSEGNSGILLYSTSNVPYFTVYYTYDNNLYKHNKNTNDGYPFIDGLATSYGDILNPDWLIDSNGIINDGYPFIDGLATSYGKCILEVGGKWYLNGNRLIPHLNGRKMITYFFGTEH
jgi:hypothetical protein